MLKFETIVIFKTGHSLAVDLDIKKYEKFFRVENSTKTKRRKLEVNTIGQKRLAYSVKDKHADPDSGESDLHEQGFYVEFKHFSTEEEIEKLKAMLRADIMVLKFLIMKCDESYKEDDIYEQFRVDAIDVIYGRASYEDIDINIKEVI